MNKRAEVNAWQDPNTALPAGTVLRATGVAGEPVENRQVNWYKYGQAPSIAQGEELPYQGPGWYRVEVQVKPHPEPKPGSPPEDAYVPYGSWRDPATGVLEDFRRGKSRMASGHQKVG